MISYIDKQDMGDKKIRESEATAIVPTKKVLNHHKK